MKYFFPDSCFFCYAQNIHILTQRSGNCSAYVLKYNFCTVFCVNWASSSNGSCWRNGWEKEAGWSWHQATRAVRAQFRKPARRTHTIPAYVHIQSQRTYTYNPSVQRTRDAKMSTACSYYNKSPDLEGSWYLIGNWGSVQLEGPLVGSYMHRETGWEGLSKWNVWAASGEEGPAQERSTPHPVSGQAAFKEGFMDSAGAVTPIHTHTVGVGGYPSCSSVKSLWMLTALWPLYRAINSF